MPGLRIEIPRRCSCLTCRAISRGLADAEAWRRLRQRIQAGEPVTFGVAAPTDPPIDSVSHCQQRANELRAEVEALSAAAVCPRARATLAEARARLV